MSDESLDKLQSMLRGEIAAAETYSQAIERCEGTHESLLREIAAEHGRAIQFFRNQLKQRGADVDTSSGSWGVFAKTVEKSALMVSPILGLRALRQGEEHGLRLYEDAVDDPELPAATRRYLTETLIPSQRRHVREFDRALASA